MRTFKRKFCFIKPFSNNYASTEGISDQSSSLTKIFTCQSIKERIRIFKNAESLQLDAKQAKDPYLLQRLTTIVNPIFLKVDSAKNLSEFVKNNKISTNVRILHALTHIQYNAFMAYSHTYFTLSSQIIDPVKRQQFKQETKRIALDEGSHFCLLNDRLETLGYKYGCLPVIDQLYLAISSTKHSLIQRIAKISLIHEGKGMKAIAKLINQLQKEKDLDSIQILKIIEKEETHHFQNGVKWFSYLCHQQNKNVLQTCEELMQQKQFKLLEIQDVNKTIQEHGY